MKLSMWQQFSSNHSNDFAVVGRFASTDDAKVVAAQFREWMSKIAWKRQNSDLRGFVTDTEKEIQQAYQIDWYEEGLDWNGVPESIDEVVQQFQADVFLMCPLETWDSTQPFVNLMTKLGALHIDSFRGEPYEIILHLTCTDDETKSRNFCDYVMKTLEAERPPIGYAHWKQFFENDGIPMSGHCRCEGNKLELRLVFIDAHDVYLLLDYLERNGFREIDYRLELGEGER